MDSAAAVKTLLLQISAPEQSWGDGSKFDLHRLTSSEPTKSGIVGMLAAALGRSREDDISDLASLKFGVRVDREGWQTVDFQTAKLETSQKLRHKHHLNDAVFLVGLEGEPDKIAELEEAVRSPYFPLYCGRKVFPLASCDYDAVRGVRACGLEQALREEPWLLSEQERSKIRGDVYLRLILDSDTRTGVKRCDMPLSFGMSTRGYWYRNVKELPRGVKIQSAEKLKVDTDEDFFDAI